MRLCFWCFGARVSCLWCGEWRQWPRRLDAYYIHCVCVLYLAILAKRNRRTQRAHNTHAHRFNGRPPPFGTVSAAAGVRVRELLFLRLFKMADCQG